MAVRYTQLAEVAHFDEDQNGVMRVEAIARHPGVLTYHRVDGSETRELVSTELLRGFQDGEPVAAALANIPVCNDHPPIMLEGLKSRIDQYGVGKTGDVVHVAKDGTTKVVFETADPETKQDIRTGRKSGVSVGYKCATTRKGGISPEGVRFDGFQDIPFVGDHLAVCAYPRATGALITKFDSSDSEHDVAWATLNDSVTQERHTPMATITIGSSSYECDASVASAVNQHIDGLSKKLNEAEEKDADKKAKIEELEEEKDGAKADAEYWQASAEGYSEALAQKIDSGNMDSDAVGEEIVNRMDSWNGAASALSGGPLSLTSELKPFEIKDGSMGYDPKMDSMAIKRGLLSAMYPETDFSGKADSYIEPYLDAQLEFRKATNQEVTRTDSTTGLKAAIQGAVPASVAAPRVDARFIRQQHMDMAEKMSDLPISESLRLAGIAQ